jgi:hypothetical protein
MRISFNSITRYMPQNPRSVLAFVFITLLVFTTGCIEEEEEGNGNITDRPNISLPLRGVSLSPRSNDPQDFTGFFEKAIQTGEIVSWVGDWAELNQEDGGGPRVVACLASTYGYTPLVIAQFFIQSTGQLPRPLTPETKQMYLEGASNFASEFRPAYLGLGVEINVLYEKSPEQFDEFVEFFGEVYHAIKSISPETKVFTVFQLERMKGLHGGLFGGANDPSNSQWDLLDQFENSDLIAFTTYPGLIHKSPDLIPADYYREIISHTDKPIAFTEIGWHSEDGPLGWESSEEEQAEFVETFLDLSGDLNSGFLIWSFLYDPVAIEPFRSMGLCDREDGRERPAWNAWKSS